MQGGCKAGSSCTRNGAAEYSMNDLARRCALASVVLGATIGLATGVAAQQSSAPVGLLGKASNDLPVQSLPLPTPEMAPSPGEAKTSAAGIEVGVLSNVTPDYAGTLQEGGGGFPFDMWKGTQRTLVERLLPHLPAASTSLAMRDLERRLLLSNAEAPEGKDAGVNLFTARAERLAAMGLSQDATALLAMMPSRMVDETAARLRIDLLLSTGDISAACRAVDDTRQAANAAPTWQQAQVFCQLNAGQRDQAALGLDLLRDQGTKDPAFFTLADALGGQTVKLDSLPNPTPLELAMLRRADLALPADAAQSRQPGVLMAIAQDTALDEAARLGAAERSAAIGALAIEKLQQAYAAIRLSPEDLGNAVAASAKESGPRGRALLYQATGAAAQPSARAHLLQAAFERARRQGDYLLAAHVNLDYLLPITPAPDLAWFSADAGRALYAMGRYEQANAWLELAQSRAAKDSGSAASAAVLAVYARIAGVGRSLSWDPAALSEWRQSPASTEAAQRVLAIFDGLGEPIPGGWAVIPDSRNDAGAANGGVPNPAVLFSLEEAASKRRFGETVLLALYALGSAGPAGCDPLSLSRAIESLRRVGLDSEARAIAVEAAITAGV
jgi:hypothetical protein